MEQKQYEVLCGFMEHLTKDYVWYYDTPEQRFEYTPESIWLINPKTKEWALELKKECELWWYSNFYVNFQRYFNMERSDFESFIKLWVEDVLNRGVSTTNMLAVWNLSVVEDVLNRGVSTTWMVFIHGAGGVEDVLNRGVSTTLLGAWSLGTAVEDVLNRGVSTTPTTLILDKQGVEDVLNRGVSTTWRCTFPLFLWVEDVLKNGKTIQ